MDIDSGRYKKLKTSDAETTDFGMYASVAKDLESLLARQRKMLEPFLAQYSSTLAGSFKGQTKMRPVHGKDQCQIVVISDSDEEDDGDVVSLASNDGPKAPERSHCLHEDDNVVVIDYTTTFEAKPEPCVQHEEKPMGENSIKAIAGRDDREGGTAGKGQKRFDCETETKEAPSKEQKCINSEIGTKEGKGIYVGIQDDLTSKKSSSNCDFGDGLGDIWREMTLALEISRETDAGLISFHLKIVYITCGREERANSLRGISTGVEQIEEEKEEDCAHSFVLKDDLGYVCRVCGIIQKSIETILDYQWLKGTKTSRNYMSEYQRTKDGQQSEGNLLSGVNASDHHHIVSEAELFVHPRHMKQMKPHQIEGFKFLQKNLLSDEPGGCIMAHAPGSGKTFMIISFIQSFLAKYPNGRPLIILPKGIVSTWRNEFQRWQVQEIPCYDFYSLKANNRAQQLDVLKQWIDHKGILFLGYQQFSKIISDYANDKVAAACHDILLTVPTLLILDEGHTPRNKESNVLCSLAKIQTPRKVVLSGTLFQNHVKEVFNILDLVRPKFLKMDSSQAIRRRIMSRAQISSGKKLFKGNTDVSFFDVVEETLQHEADFKRKVTVIQDLREMTEKVLHYYKGDFLDELPGLVDITVFLNLTAKQKKSLENLEKLGRIESSAPESAIYLHPLLKEFSKSNTAEEKYSTLDEDELDNLVNKVNVKDGVKANFFLNLLDLCEAAGEKLLVFSQYRLPVKFLERLIMKTKGWIPGKEIFSISGESSPEHREWSTERFNTSADAKVFFGAIKACGEGISLVGASRLLILDVHMNPSVTRQAIGRAFRPGQREKYMFTGLLLLIPQKSNTTMFLLEKN
ncbi:hypothetical protein Sjap_014853 [Stephania japonica]|uniref:Uncharacterized protein n=1 Tax=Stephania japonica TaxID=461633 RepID=A0AAP0IJJ2_9MAGN